MREMIEYIDDAKKQSPILYFRPSNNVVNGFILALIIAYTPNVENVVIAYPWYAIFLDPFPCVRSPKSKTVFNGAKTSSALNNSRKASRISRYQSITFSAYTSCS